MSRRTFLSQVDYGLLALLLILSLMGLGALWSASHGAEGQIGGFALRQLKWFGVGLVAMMIAAAIDYRHLHTHAYLLYGILLLMLVGVMMLGKTSMGAQRWLPLGPIRFQPSEFMKISIAIVTAKLMTQETEKPPYGFRALVRPALFTVVPVGMILLQPDLGTALLVAAVACAVVLFQGVRKKVLLIDGREIQVCAVQIIRAS